MRVFICGALLCLSGSVAWGGGLPDAKSVKAMLYKTGKNAVGVRILDPGDRFSAEEETILKIAGQSILYYGAMAFPAGEGIYSKSAAAAANFHSLERAREVALEGCNAKRAAGAGRCEVVVEILPAGHQAGRAVELNHDASHEFARKYSRQRGARAFAVSDATAAWGWASKAAGLEAAITEAEAACAAKGGKDCRAVSAEE